MWKISGLSSRVREITTFLNENALNGYSVLDYNLKKSNYEVIVNNEYPILHVIVRFLCW